jgi:preprotein translocase subunit SecY
MASAIEQMSKNMSWATFARATELKQRIWFVLVALVIYRLGTFVPIPGIDPNIWAEIFNTKAGGVLDMFNMFSGGSLSRMSIFALSIMPYISASIIIQLGSSIHKPWKELKRDGESGRMKLNQYTRYLTVVLATVQGWGLAVGLENMQGQGGSAVIDPGLFFRVSTVITIVGGTMFLVWLGEQITSRGIGNGISLIIFAGIVAELPRALGAFFELGRQGQFSAVAMLMIVALVIAVLLFIIFMERAQRRVMVQYPKRQMGNQMSMGSMNHIPFKLNMSGVIPPIFASSLLLLPLSIVGFTGADGGDVTATIARYLQHGQPIYMIAYGALIVFFAFFYTAIVFNPEENAEMLRKNGGFLPGIRPGKSTADYFDFILTRLTVIGSAYLCVVCLLPEFLISEYAVPFYFGGTSLLIVVSVTMDTVAQIHSHLIAHQYEGLIKKSRLKG